MNDLVSKYIFPETGSTINLKFSNYLLILLQKFKAIQMDYLFSIVSWK